MMRACVTGLGQIECAAKFANTCSYATAYLLARRARQRRTRYTQRWPTLDKNTSTRTQYYKDGHRAHECLCLASCAKLVARFLHRIVLPASPTPYPMHTPHPASCQFVPARGAQRLLFSRQDRRVCRLCPWDPSRQLRPVTAIWE